MMTCNTSSLLGIYKQELWYLNETKSYTKDILCLTDIWSPTIKKDFKEFGNHTSKKHLSKKLCSARQDKTENNDNLNIET